MQIPDEVVPILDAVRQKCPPGTPLEIWKGDNQDAWVENFFTLSMELMLSDLQESDLPRGYGLVAHLMDWEAQCQFDGWQAITNRRENLPNVIAGFREVGLGAEADAIARAAAAWVQSGGDHDAASAAYGEVRHEYSIDLDRIEHLVCYFIDNADRLFYR